MSTLTSRWLRELRRAVSWHRRLLAAALVGAAVAATLTALAPEPPPSVAVLAAAHDLAGGAPLAAADLAEVLLPPEAVPSGALPVGQPVEGRVLAGPVRRGEALTDLRLLGPSLLERYGAGVVAAPVRIADPATARLLRPGDLIDVLAAETGLGATSEAPGATGSSAPAARVIAPGVRVVAVPADDELGGGFDVGGGALVVLATSGDVAAELARAAVTARLSVTLRAH